MHPILDNLPRPPEGKSGWPWTEGNLEWPQTTPDGHPWPLISIVTPSFNQGCFIEETIRSVLLQGYPNFEFIIIDGGSKDETVPIIKKYEPWLAYWVSELDEGQAHAINKGFERAKGEILAWLNSDDIYLPGVFQMVACHFHREPQATVVFGDAIFIDENGTEISRYMGINRSFIRRMMYWRGWDVPQPTVFLRRRVLVEAGYLDESYKYALDYEWFLRIACSRRFNHLGKTMACYRVHQSSKTGFWEDNKAKFHRECRRANLKYAPPLSPKWFFLEFMKTVFRMQGLLKKVISQETIQCAPYCL